MTEKRRVTMQDVADRAGVSRATVSLALRNYPGLSRRTRERIQAVARELGYRPDAVYAALMAQVRARQAPRQTATLAFVTAFPTRDGWRKNSSLFRDYFEGAVERADQLGYRVDEIWAREPAMTGHRLTKVLAARGIRGLLIAPIPAAYGHLSLDWSRFAVATFGFSLRAPDLPRASMDASRNLTLALRQLKRRGYRRIGWMIPQAGLERNNYHPLAALWAYQRGIAAANRISPFIYDVWQDARAAVWLRKNRPDAIIASGFQWVLRWLGQCGRRVPQEIGFVNFSRSEGERSAGIDPHPRLVGAAAVDLVVGQLHRNEIGLPDFPKVVLVPGRWVAGPTLQKS